MRSMLAGADLAGYAGQFVWLELNFDKAENRAFFAKYGAIGTPTFYIIDPWNGRVAASQSGAMSLEELKQFLERGARGVSNNLGSPADAALKRGDGLLAQKPEEAVAAYREAIQIAPSDWPHRELSEASLAVALRNAGRYQECAETAAREAAHMKRDTVFARTIVTGMWCLVAPAPAPWSKQGALQLEPLAKEALSLQTTELDHRDELYRTLMYLCLARDDKVGAADWGERWLDELDARRPTNDEERAAVDTARVENVQTFGDPKRILPGLIASEQAMPASWNASLRVAQMESAAKNYDAAIAACERGLVNAGPAGRSWLLRIKADALLAKGQRGPAEHAFEQALTAANAIPDSKVREANIRTIKAALQSSRNTGKN